VEPLRGCPGCGRPVAPWQEYCLECGSRVPWPHGVVAGLGRWWRRHLPGYPGDWIWPALGALALAAGGGAAAIAATGGATRSLPRTITATSALLAPATTVAAPNGRRVVAWPHENGWTIVLATYPVTNGGGVARDRAATALQAGLPQVGILLSSNFASLHPGYYVVFSGVYASQDDAQAALPTASRRFQNAAVRPITR
jgi:hypothetical protein